MVVKTRVTRLLKYPHYSLVTEKHVDVYREGILFKTNVTHTEYHHKIVDNRLGMLVAHVEGFFSSDENPHPSQIIHAIERQSEIDGFFGEEVIHEDK